MGKLIRQDEVRIVIRPLDAPTDSVRLVPAAIFKRSFNTLLSALSTANEELHSKKYKSEFFISNLEMGSNIFEVREQRRSASASLAPSIDLFKQSAGAVYRSDYARVAGNLKIANSIIKIGEAIDEKYPAVIYFGESQMPLDGFFAKQTAKLKQFISSKSAESSYFAGSVIGAFGGRLGSIDYRGAAWTGYLVLPGGGAQIECVFDRTKGEDEFNRYGNKRVSITGRAIYTGDSQLPERMEVISIDEVPLAIEAVDIRGSLTGKHYFVGWDREDNHFQ